MPLFFAPLDDGATARLAVVDAAPAAVVTVDPCSEAAGTTALFRDHPWQRRQRAVLAFPGLETVGRVLSLLKPATPLL